MKKLLTFFFCTLTILSYGQKNKNKGPQFDLEDFNKKAVLTEWLFQYDQVAWWTSDSVMTQDKKELARLGNEWFCFQDQNNLWHAVYGKYAGGNFDLVFHYTVENKSRIKRTFESVDTTRLNSYSRALITAKKQLASFEDSVHVRFNQFVRQNDDKTFTVWVFPAFQPDYTAVYGGEFIYTIDPSGNKIVKDDSYFQGNLRGFKVGQPREIWLNYRDTEKPTLGAVFFVWYYKEYFTSIYIECSKSNTTLFKDEKNGYSWIHAEKK